MRLRAIWDWFFAVEDCPYDEEHEIALANHLDSLPRKTPQQISLSASRHREHLEACHAELCDCYGLHPNDCDDLADDIYTHIFNGRPSLAEINYQIEREKQNEN